MSPDEPLPSAIANPAFVPPEAVHEAFELVQRWRRERTARGTLVLAFVAPLHVRKPPHQGNPPVGWTRVLITSHLLTELNGVWWVPSGIVDHLARFTGVA